jgi:hypothetical protein
MRKLKYVKLFELFQPKEEEAENKKMNELFGFGKKKKEKELREPTEEEIRTIYIYFNGGRIYSDTRSITFTDEDMIGWFSNHFSGPNRQRDATEAVKSAKTSAELYQNLGLKYPGMEKIQNVMDKWRNR